MRLACFRLSDLTRWILRLSDSLSVAFLADTVVCRLEKWEMVYDMDFSIFRFLFFVLSWCLLVFDGNWVWVRESARQRGKLGQMVYRVLGERFMMIPWKNFLN